MFGKEKLQALEAKIGELKKKLQDSLKEKDELKKELEASRKQISDLQAKWDATDLEQTRKQMEASIAEYEGLKDLYNRKINEFNSTRDGKEQEFARHAALERHNLENEIKDNREANQEYVSSTVKAFGESYNYYLNQIKMLMDALGDVASKTGEALFAGGNEDLKARMGQQMAEKLKAETDPLRDESGNLILIGGADKAEEPVPEECPAEESQPEEAPELPAEEETDTGYEPAAPAEAEACPGCEEAAAPDETPCAEEAPAAEEAEEAKESETEEVKNPEEF